MFQHFAKKKTWSFVYFTISAIYQGEKLFFFPSLFGNMGYNWQGVGIRYYGYDDSFRAMGG